jgi:F0F1-type ATP synthase assembly protein I
LKFLISAYAGLVFGAMVGALIGFAVQQAIGQSGWSLVVGALGACLGSFWAGLRRAEGKPLWRVRTEPPPAAPDPSDS